MPIRNTTHILKNSDIVARPLPSTLLKGEAIVNTADGIMFFSGVTTSTSGWTSSGPTTPTFFEVGSNLYDLKIRNKIASYSGLTNLSGKFLSGTTSGFVLADISSITGIDSYVTGGTFNNITDTLTLTLSEGKPNVTVTGFTDYYTTGATLIGSTAYFNRNDALSAYTLDLSTFVFTGDTLTTGFTYSNNVATIKQNQGQPDLSILINTMTGLTVNGTLSATTINGGTANLDTINATAGTITTLGSTTINGGNLNLTGGIQSYSGGTNLAGQFLSGTTNGFVLGAISAITGVDTYVTGFTYTPASNTLTINRNQGQPSLTTQINTVSGLTVSNLTAGRVVYVGTAGLLTDESGFEYNTSTNTLAVENIDAAGNVVIQGSLTVFGPSVSAFTSQLYVEDPNITLNYNPTGSTTVTSVNAGLTIQDGNGITGGSVNLDIVRMQNLTGLTVTQIPNVSEYVGTTGYVNRGWITQLNDIVIRSTDVADGGSAGDINGVRVLAEFDVLDGGSY
jgi:hypothetical protein